MKNLKRIIAAVILVTSFVSCSSNDDANPTSNCDDFINQEAKGTVKGFDFTNQGGTYTLMPDGKYKCSILTKEAIGGSCFFPEFDPFSEELREVKILFSLDELTPQTITFTDTVEVGGTLDNTLNFNAIHYDSSTNNNYTDIELATCGTLEIIAINNNKITGKIVAKGQKGSTINGNFTLDLCDF